MNLFSNPIIFCGSVALGIFLILILVVVICCKRSAAKEREELKALSEEIECDFKDEVVSASEEKIENVLSKMQEALDLKEEKSVSFEQEQEENAIISYQELLNSLGAKSSIDIDSIEVFDDELDNQIEISDFNKEIIDSYQNENLEREIFRFQNDYSSEALSSEIVDESPIMNFDFSGQSMNFDIEDSNVELEAEEKIEDEVSNEVYEARHVVENMPKKFKRTEFISPVYGIIKENKTNDFVQDDVEEIIFDENDSLLD